MVGAAGGTLLGSLIEAPPALLPLLAAAVKPPGPLEAAPPPFSGKRVSNQSTAPRRGLRSAEGGRRRRVCLCLRELQLLRLRQAQQAEDRRPRIGAIGRKMHEGKTSPRPLNGDARSSAGPSCPPSCPFCIADLAIGSLLYLASPPTAGARPPNAATTSSCGLYKDLLVFITAPLLSPRLDNQSPQPAAAPEWWAGGRGSGTGRLPVGPPAAHILHSGVASHHAGALPDD